MPEVKSYKDLNEKVIELILNFKPRGDFNKSAQDEILLLKNYIKKLISSFPENKRQILELRYFEHLSHVDIEQKTGKSKDEILKTLLSSIEDIKENIRKNKLNLENLEEKVSLNPEKGFAWLIGFFGMAIFIVVIILSLIFLQKLFVNQTPVLTKLKYDIKNTVQGEDSQDRQENKTHKRISTHSSDKIKIVGSTSLLLLSNRWTDAFSIEYPKYKVKLVPSDSDGGINALIEGNADIANSSRPVTFSDQKRAARYGIELAEHRVALDALIVLVNKKNPIEELSLDELKNIFSGEVENWQELRGSNIPILPVAREEGSGTNDFVVNRILQGNDLPSSFLRIKSNQEIMKYISESEGTISFTNSTNFPWEQKQIKYLKIKTYENSSSVAPYENGKLSEKAMRYGDYPLSHYLYLITLSEPSRNVQDYIGWVLSPEGQKAVKSLGLISVIEEE